MARKKEQTAKVITPAGMKPKPRQHEREAADVLALHFNTFVEFLPRANGKTADFIIDGVVWELKSPQGKGKNNIERQLKYASKQSKNIVIDSSRSKLHINKIKGTLTIQFKKTRSIKRILLIDKSKKVIEIQRSLCYSIGIVGSSVLDCTYSEPSLSSREPSGSLFVSRS